MNVIPLKKSEKTSISVGLDLGAYAARMVKLKFARDAVELAEFDIKPRIQDIVVPRDTRHFVISLSGSSAIIRYVYFPQMNAEELRTSLKFEAQKHIPFPVSDLHMDSFVLKEHLPDNKMLVLLVAVRKEVVRRRLDMFREAQVSPGVIDVDSVALVNAFTFNYPEQSAGNAATVALLNIDGALCSLSILEGNIPRLSRDIQAASGHSAQQPAGGSSKMPDEAAAVEAALTELAGEVRTSFDYFESQSTSSVAKIYVSGGTGMKAEARDTLKALLGLEVECWDPLRRIKPGEKTDAQAVKAAAGELAVAVGLALHI